MSYTRVDEELKDLSRIFTFKALARLVGSSDSALRHNARGWSASGMRSPGIARKIKSVHEIAKSQGWI